MKRVWPSEELLVQKEKKNSIGTFIPYHTTCLARRMVTYPLELKRWSMDLHAFDYLIVYLQDKWNIAGYVS